MAEIAVAISGKVSELLIAPIGRHLGLFFQFTRNVETLIKEMEKLQNLKDDVKQEVKVAVNNVDNILNTVETWLDHVDLVDEEAKSIIEDKARFPNGCLNNWCLNLKSRYVLSRRAKKKTQDIIELQQEGNFPKVSLPAPPLLLVGFTSTAFDSRELILNKIIESLRDEDINMIGICGMGGMGKTTMAEKVFKRVKEENMFDDYAMTVVSQRAEMINVQKDIAEMLGLKLKENNPVLRASRLNQRLEGKKVFIIVDDVWEQFDLQALGITLQDGQSKCKIVFTSRTQGLWMDFRSRRHELSLDPLTHNESWKLFTDKLGNFLDDNSELVSIAQQIVNECAGLPLALVTLGSALLGKSKHAWNDTLLKLRTISGMQQKVYESIRLSYDHLGDEEAKSLFLLCSLFKEDSHINIQRLVDIGMGLRLFRGINKVEAARDRVFALVEHLQSRCLISVKFTSTFKRPGPIFGPPRFVKVHDVVRDVSKSIAFTEKGSLVIEHGFTLETSLEQSFVEKCTWISVILEENKELLPILQFPRLKLLLCNHKDVQVPDSYFEGMVKLQVIDISCSIFYPRVIKFPSSLQSLTSLHTLCLRNFILEDFTAIKYLQSLEILRISDKCIEELPKEIGQLSKLRLLDMSDCKKLKKFSLGIISGLTSLEELYLGGLKFDWGAEKTEEGRKAVRREFESLSNLCILHILIQDPIFLPRTPVLRDLKKYHIHIGCFNEYNGLIYGFLNYERILSICNVDLDNDFDFLVHNSEALLLKGKSTKRLVYELVQGVSQSIRCLVIRNTDTPEYLADATDSTKAPFLVSKLESLTLHSLTNLQQITNGALVAGNISKLKELVVSNCKLLRNVFRLSNVLDVLQLEKLHVSNCESMEEVICWEGREENSICKLQFPKLVDLKIGGESFVCFCKGAKEIELQQLERLSLTGIASIISISDENRGSSIFPSKVLFPSLVDMELYKLKNMKEIWCGQLQSTGSFLNLSELEIKGCDSLEYVFSPYMATYLVHLQRLRLENCQSLKEIVNGPLMMGSSLLKLKYLTVQKCNQLRNLLQLSTAVDTLDLERLLIVDCENMEEVISWEGRREEEDAATTKILLFPNLRELIIKKASSLKCFCKGAMEIEFHQLYNLDLWDLPAVECLVPIFFPHKVFFPSLVRMELRQLKNMKEIWCGQLQSSGSFLNLSTLNIHKCHGLEYVFSPYMATYLVHLQNLYIENCQSLKEIVNGPLMMGSSLLKLKDLRVKGCNQLRNLLQLSTAVDTLDLEKLSIKDCERMEEVISWEGRPEEDAATRKLIFPNLRSLNIYVASSLICFCKGAMEIEFHQLTSLSLDDLPAVECLVPIFFPHKVLFPSLVDMGLYKLKNMKEIWCGQLQSTGSFLNLSTVEIYECDSLEYVFSPYTASYLVHLRRLDIAECKNLKEVISAEKEVDGIEEYSKRILPKLKDVKLYQLPALDRFYHVANYIEFHELDNVVVVDCPVFKSFSPVFVHTPILSHVKLYQEKKYGPSLKEEEKVTMWKGDLNSTIQHFHKIQIKQQEQQEDEEEEDLSAQHQ